MQQLDRITAPAAPILTPTTAKQHLRVTHSAEDAIIQLYADTVEQALDGDLGHLKRALITQTWRLTLSGFPPGQIRLPLPPFQAVTALKYTPRNGDEVTLAADAYRVRRHLNEGYVTPAHDTFWPVGDMDSVVIEFRAGFGDTAATVPAPIRAAALLMLDSLYEHRGTLTPAALVANPTVKHLLTPFTVPLW